MRDSAIVPIMAILDEKDYEKTQWCPELIPYVYARILSREISFRPQKRRISVCGLRRGAQ